MLLCNKKQKKNDILSLLSVLGYFCFDLQIDCTYLILVWDKMAEKFASSGLKVGKMDSTVNEIEGMANINSYPTIRLYKKDGTQVG